LRQVSRANVSSLTRSILSITTGTVERLRTSGRSRGGVLRSPPKVPWSPAPTEHSLTAGLPACADSIARLSLTPGA
jgi:hypothetical protein